MIAADSGMAEPLSGEDIRLHRSSIVPSAATVMTDAFGSIYLETAVLGDFGAGQSSGVLGIQLQGGTTPVSEPFSGVSVAAGVFGQLLLYRRRQAS